MVLKDREGTMSSFIKYIKWTNKPWLTALPVDNESKRKENIQRKIISMSIIITICSKTGIKHLQCWGTPISGLDGIIPPHAWHCRWEVVWSHLYPSSSVPVKKFLSRRNLEELQKIH